VADYEEFDREEDISERPPDPRQISAREALIQFFEEHREQVFFSRQLEVRYEQDYFHWITNRALRDLEDLGLVRSEWRTRVWTSPAELGRCHTTIQSAPAGFL